jgi:hypothetical protein
MQLCLIYRHATISQWAPELVVNLPNTTLPTKTPDSTLKKYPTFIVMTAIILVKVSTTLASLGAIRTEDSPRLRARHP